MHLKSLFSGRSNDCPDPVTELLKKGEYLEANGKAIDAYFLYRGLVSAYPDCKACRAHMGKAKTKLAHQGIEISIIDTNVETTKSTKNDFF